MRTMPSLCTQRSSSEDDQPSSIIAPLLHWKIYNRICNAAEYQIFIDNILF
jgi:hypothetical protein